MAKVTLELVKSEGCFKEVVLTAEEVELMKKRQALDPGDEGYFDLCQQIHDSFTKNHVPEGMDMVDFEYETEDFE